MATPAEMDQYGAGIPIWDQIRLFQEWAPLIGYAQQFVAEPDAYKRSLVVGDALEWLASRTKTGLDDELVKIVAGIAHTPQGEALIRWGIAKAGVR